ncbi:MAG: hypothetical protein H7X80_07830 [bacterium]|nr:hypothetical protein [Candidatus Kapabacteria bacterium]
MNQPNRIIKTIVLASSVLLVTAFVMYRSGVFTSATDVAAPGVNDVNVAATTSAAAGAASTGAAPTDAVTGAASTGENIAHMPDTPAANPKSTPKAKDTVVRRSRFLGGSKSGVPMIDARETDTPYATRDTTDVIIDTAEPREVFMGGSKSLAPLVRPPGKDAKAKQKEDAVRK